MNNEKTIRIIYIYICEETGYIGGKNYSKIRGHMQNTLNEKA